MPVGDVYALAASGSTVYAGGKCATIGGQTRQRIAALSASTGDATSWNPDAGGDVYALATSGSAVYAGGKFTTIGGQGRRNMSPRSALRLGNATAWNPDAE